LVPTPTAGEIERGGTFGGGPGSAPGDRRCELRVEFISAAVPANVSQSPRPCSGTLLLLSVPLSLGAQSNQTSCAEFEGRSLLMKYSGAGREMERLPQRRTGLIFSLLLRVEPGRSGTRGDARNWRPDVAEVPRLEAVAGLGYLSSGRCGGSHWAGCRGSPPRLQCPPMEGQAALYLKCYVGSESRGCSNWPKRYRIFMVAAIPTAVKLSVENNRSGFE